MLLAMFNKFLGKRQSHNSSEAESQLPENVVARIQDGDLILRNQFISDYQPYVAKITSRFCKRYIDPSRDDEFSIALGAFNEAINQFDAEMGRTFLSFSETVVRRRLIDYVRKEQRFTKQVPLSSFEIEDDDFNVINPIEIQQALEEYQVTLGTEDRRSEIESLSHSLADFDIDFNDLIQISPKHTDSREMLFLIAKVLSEDVSLMNHLMSKRMLPIKELLPRVTVSRKTLERNRKYIITLALVYDGAYPYLREYLQIPADALVTADERRQVNE